MYYFRVDFSAVANGELGYNRILLYVNVCIIVQFNKIFISYSS